MVGHVPALLAILALGHGGRNLEVEASLGYKVSLCLKKIKRDKRKGERGEEGGREQGRYL